MTTRAACRPDRSGDSPMTARTPAELPPPPAGRTGWPWTSASPALPATAPGGHAWPRISIVTPSFNQGEFVEEAIRSVLLQGYPDLELVVMDAASGDDSPRIIRRYAPWLRHWVSERDGGPANALNRGFSFATGSILGFLNADDFLLPDSLAAVAREFLARPAADVLSGHGYLTAQSGTLAIPVFSDRWNLRQFSYGACVLVQPATFFRREAFERVNGFDEAIRTSWDQELWADLAVAGARFELFDAFLAAFRVHQGSITGSPRLREQRLHDSRAVLEKVRGRPAVPLDRVYEFLHRARKFSRHPGRTVRQRFFFHATLKRWSL
jgi:glycosyltransferase involved in cell wall biosynthesis